MDKRTREKDKKGGAIGREGLSTKAIVLVAVLSAMVAILASLAITTNAFKITFESLPVHFAGLMFGPLEGFLVGTIGTLIYQMLVYGFTVTTVLWIIPYSLLGLFSGLYARKHGFEMSRKQILIITVLLELMVTALNTGSIYIDSHIYGYYTPALIVGSLALRLGICIAKGIAFGLILPPIINRVKKTL